METLTRMCMGIIFNRFIHGLDIVKIENLPGVLWELFLPDLGDFFKTMDGIQRKRWFTNLSPDRQLDIYHHCTTTIVNNDNWVVMKKKRMGGYLEYPNVWVLDKTRNKHKKAKMLEICGNRCDIYHCRSLFGTLHNMINKASFWCHCGAEKSSHYWGKLHRELVDGESRPAVISKYGNEVTLKYYRFGEKKRADGLPYKIHKDGTDHIEYKWDEYSELKSMVVWWEILYSEMRIKVKYNPEMKDGITSYTLVLEDDEVIEEIDKHVWVRALEIEPTEENTIEYTYTKNGVVHRDNNLPAQKTYGAYKWFFHGNQYHCEERKHSED